MPRKKAQKTAVTYHAHRERQRRRILDAAWKLFDERGIDRVTMAEITSVSGVQPSTVYQYFANKDDIVWALLRETMQEGSGRAKQIMDAAPDALARLTALLDLMADELENNQSKIRFMAQFDAMYARDWPAERLITLESQINPAGFQVFTDLIREGIADGSLRSDLDPDLTMHALINAVIGAQRRLASLGNKIEQEYGKPIARLFRETIRVLLMGLRAPETPARRKPPKTQKTDNVRNRKRSL
jgi:AcrR family transcriptional regulator